MVEDVGVGSALGVACADVSEEFRAIGRVQPRMAQEGVEDRFGDRGDPAGGDQPPRAPAMVITSGKAQAATIREAGQASRKAGARMPSSTSPMTASNRSRSELPGVRA